VVTRHMLGADREFFSYLDTRREAMDGVPDHGQELEAVGIC